MSSSVESVVLPNGDVWRPRYNKVSGGSSEPKHGLAAVEGTECPWCGMDCKTKPALRTHVTSKHKSVMADRETLEKQAALAAALSSG